MSTTPRLVHGAMYDQLRQDLDTARSERDEAERLLRLSYIIISGKDRGDQSLAHVRKEQSDELADIALAIEACGVELRSEIAELQKRPTPYEVDAWLRQPQYHQEGLFITVKPKLGLTEFIKQRRLKSE